MADKPKPRVGSHWKRPPTKVYEYNYDVGQHYYQPMMRHLEKKDAGVSSEMPGPKTFAERLAEDPLYGRSKPVNYVSSDFGPSNPARNSGAEGPSRRPDFGDLYKGLDDGLGDDLLTRHRPRSHLPSVSDQILEGAGLKTDDSFLNDALAEIRSKRRQHAPNAEDLVRDPFFSRGASAGRIANLEDSLTKRRNLLRDMDDDLEKIDSSLEKYNSSRLKGSSVDDMALTSSSKLSASSSSSLNIKKRQVKTTVTTETVRY